MGDEQENNVTKTLGNVLENTQRYYRLTKWKSISELLSERNATNADYVLNNCLKKIISKVLFKITLTRILALVWSRTSMLCEAYTQLSEGTKPELTKTS